MLKFTKKCMACRTACSFRLCGSIVANPIIYRLVPSPSRYEIRQLLEVGSSWARYFRSGISTFDVIFLTRDWFTFDRLLMSVGVLSKSLSIQKFILGKVGLKAVVKVGLSLQRLAFARQVEISNYTMIVPSQLPPKKKLPVCSTLNK